MTSFHAKIVWKRQRKRENTNYRFVLFLTEEDFKIAKKFEKLKNASMVSFKVRIGWKRSGKNENKYCRSVSVLSNA